MKYLRQFFYFLGSVSFAILLLFLTLLVVIGGTFVESYANSHQLAMQTVYSHPLFVILSLLFFINILVSALLRWPFKKKHIPFLFTHLGLLLVIGGTVIKNLKGQQGHLFLWEGSGSHELIKPYSHALQIIAKESKEPLIISLNRLSKNWTTFSELPSLKWRLASFAPHVHESYETWIKGAHGHIAGYLPFAVHFWKISDPLPSPSLLLNSQDSYPWEVIAFKTENSSELVKNLYLDSLFLEVCSKENLTDRKKIYLKESLSTPLDFAGGLIYLNLDLEKQELIFQWKDHFSNYEEKLIFLLHFFSPSKIKKELPENLKSQFEFSLERLTPLIAFIEEEEMTNVWSFNLDGTFFKEGFSSTSLKNLVMYDRGFGGYSVQTSVPLVLSPIQKKNQLLKELTPLLTTSTPLAPPFELLKQACKEAELDFNSAVIDFFQAWNDSSHLLLDKIPPSLKTLLPYIKWSSLSLEEKKALQWITFFFSKLSFSIRQGGELLTILKNYQWPFLSSFENQKKKEQTDPFSLLAQQIFSIIHDLPLLQETSNNFTLLSAYFQLYGIEANLLDPLKKNFSFPSLLLETSLISHLLPLPSPLKVEEQRPGIILEVADHQHIQSIPLAYFSVPLGLKWPFLKGKYQVRFQPETVLIPHHVRLRQARKLTYPHSLQTYSYEADVLIEESDHLSVPFTLTMNRIYETWKGYRFYLSGIQGEDNSIKQVQLAVNYDPAKYFLTYPGVFILFLGIGLLFWVRPYRQSSSHFSIKK